MSRTWLWKTATAKDPQELGAAFFTQQAAENVCRWYAIIREFGTFAQAPNDVLHFLHYLNTLHRQYSGNSLELMGAASNGGEGVRAE